MTTPKKILIADDDTAFLSLYSKFINKAGFFVFEAHDGEEAVNLALANKPDALVIDISMPKKDGLEVLSVVRKEEWGKKIPIIVLTGKDTTDEYLLKITDLEPTYFIIKGSESAEAFIEKIKEITTS